MFRISQLFRLGYESLLNGFDGVFAYIISLKSRICESAESIPITLFLFRDYFHDPPDPSLQSEVYFEKLCQPWG